MGGERLARGAVHEWFGLVETSKDKEQSQLRWHAHFRGRQWMPPLCILAHLARRCLVLDTEGENEKWSAWIGKRVWLYPHVLTLEGGGLFLTPGDENQPNPAVSLVSPTPNLGNIQSDPCPNPK